MRRFIKLFFTAVLLAGSLAAQPTPTLKLLLLQSVEANQALDQVVQSAFAEMASGKMTKRQALYLFLELKQTADISRIAINELTLRPEWSEIDNESGLLVLLMWTGQSRRLELLAQACGLEADAGRKRAQPYWNSYRSWEKKYGAVKSKVYSLWYRGGCDAEDEEPASSPSPTSSPSVSPTPVPSSSPTPQNWPPT
ncbi:MAG: hypothetical protein J0I12_11050 [Candidatus Eremiobacteraeota bacterium]|nr:hypothetical protein [Candidatus Eremiobacteraeota bacterium]